MDKIAAYEILLEDHPLWQEEKLAGIAAMGRVAGIRALKTAPMGAVAKSKALSAVRRTPGAAPLLQRPQKNISSLLNKIKSR